MRRREFLGKTLAGTAVMGLGSTSLLTASNKGPNDKIIIGVMGLGPRNNFMIKEFIKQGAEIAYLCDVDTRKYNDGLNACEGQSRIPKTVQDFRRVLDDQDVTAMLVAPGSHWSPLATIMSCQAGKDVYVEKPMSPNIYEGRKMVEAAHKYNRVVQVGCQNRSGEYHEKAIQFLKEGNLGRVHYVRVLNMLKGRRGNPGPYPEMPVPKELDYDMWCGPAPKLPYNSNKTAAHIWRHFWDYSGTDSESIHQLDIANWVISSLTGRVHPISVYSKGAIRYPHQVADQPDSMNTIFDWGDITLSFDVDWWTSLIKVPTEIRESNSLFPDWKLTGTRIEIYGTNGIMYLGRHGGGWQTFDEKGEPGAELAGIMPFEEHIANFLDCIRTRQIPNGDIAKAQNSHALAHMAYISHRVGNQLLKVGRSGERFIENDEANMLLARVDGGRAPWKIPGSV